ncbi:Shedu anti-phage system protein SduA domain-containing protein [Pantoea sp. DY-5]|uniref:Shedu anti-phage system protein SduA domain-containing protein n=1 Tax=Pantoea sp. DY-5 TaxID=2871488 RepID=UPI001C96983E|nr:Shedu anti-phage system protein SduA domain-containing protein [Pantoea sp. DY-5]MBY4841217.1 DUF4263 domain-containing protein [Pantoea sp. DY-5]
MIVLKSGQLRERDCRSELDEFASFLLAGKDIKETDLLDFFEARPQLILLMGRLVGVEGATQYNNETPIIGKYRADFVVSNDNNSTFAFIEFENAMESSIFTKKINKKTLAHSWSLRFEHGYSQVIDWYHHLHENNGTQNMQAEFGRHNIKYYGALIIGRANSLNKSDCRHRFEKRIECSTIYNKHITCYTFDDLYEEMELEYQILSGFK